MKASNIPGDDTSFFFFISLSFGFLSFDFIINFYKNCFIIIIIILFIYFHENVFFSMFRDVPECSMFRILSTAVKNNILLDVSLKFASCRNGLNSSWNCLMCLN